MSLSLDSDRPPSKVQVIGIMHLIGGIMNIMAALAWSAAGILTGIFTFGIGLLYCCPAILLFPVAGLEIYSGIKHLSSDHSGLKEPKLVAIVEIASFLGGGAGSARSLASSR